MTNILIIREFKVAMVIKSKVLRKKIDSTLVKVGKLSRKIKNFKKGSNGHVRN